MTVSIQPKAVLRKWLGNMDLKLFRSQNIPIGTFLPFDLKRLFSDQKIQTIFDVGANVGQAAQFFQENFSQAHIHAFEPVPSTYRQLAQNIKSKNVECHLLGFGDKRSSEEIWLQKSSVFNSLNDSVNVADPAAGSGKESVEIHTIDQFCLDRKVERIDLLKIDTEGHDVQVLRGAESMLRQRKVTFVLVEVGFHPDNPRNTPFQAAFEFLGERNFRLCGFYNQSHHSPKRLDCADALFTLSS